MSIEITDHRLVPLAQDLTDKKYDVLSLDIFDTLLWRRVPEPTDIFTQVGVRLLDQGHLNHSVSITQFADLRAAAEKQTRSIAEAHTGSREVLLEDVYEVMPSHVFTSADSLATAVKVEVACEQSAMMLDHEVVALMGVARGQDVGVVLTSDTYFTRAQLLQFLIGAGLDEADIPETLYISNEHGRPKWRDLFDGILAELAVPPERMVHVGDNVDADVRPCALRNIASVFYDKWSGLPRTREKELPRAPSDRSNWIVSGGDAGLTGLRSRLVHRPPTGLGTGLQSYWTYGATTLAPLFAAYATWVVDTASDQNATVLGLMREGRFLTRLVASVARTQNTAVTNDELWLSRRAVVRAALWPDDLSLLAQAISYCPGPSTDDVLEQLGLSRADLSGVFKDPTLVDVHAPGGVQALLTAISRVPELQEKVVAHSAQLRRNLLVYLDQQEAFQGDAPVLLLDLGYAGTIQTVLQKILDYEGRPVRLAGLYVAVNSKGKERVLTGVDLRALVNDDGYESGLASLLERTPDILEHACMCPEGSLDSFDENGAPVLLPSQRSASQIAQMEAMQDGIVAGVSSILDTLGESVATESGFREYAANIVKQAMLYPTSQEVSTIGAWLHEANFDLADQRALADLRLDPTRLEFGGALTWSSLERHEAYWSQAALARMPALSEAATLVAEGHPIAAFTSGATLGVLSIVPDLGVGPETRQAVTVPLSVSVLGRGELQVQIKPMGPNAYQAVHIQWPATRSVIEVAQCAVLFQGETEQKAEDVTQHLQASYDVQAIDGTLVTGPDGAKLSLDLTALTPPWPHSLDLLLRFKYLRIDRIF